VRLAIQRTRETLAIRKDIIARGALIGPFRRKVQRANDAEYVATRLRPSERIKKENHPSSRCTPQHKLNSERQGKQIILTAAARNY